jgi:hypothetical protein
LQAGLITYRKERKQGWPQGENLGGEACRFYLGGEPGEEFSPSAETNVALAARHYVTDHITPEWSGCDSQHSL